MIFCLPIIGCDALLERPSKTKKVLHRSESAPLEDKVRTGDYWVIIQRDNFYVPNAKFEQVQGSDLKEIYSRKYWVTKTKSRRSKYNYYVSDVSSETKVVSFKKMSLNLTMELRVTMIVD